MVRVGQKFRGAFRLNERDFEIIKNSLLSFSSMSPSFSIEWFDERSYITRDFDDFILEIKNHISLIDTLRISVIDNEKHAAIYLYKSDTPVIFQVEGDHSDCVRLER